MVREYMGAVCFAQLRGFRPDYYSYFSNFVTAKKLATLLSPSRNIFQMLFQRPRKSRLSPTCTSWRTTTWTNTVIQRRVILRLSFHPINHPSPPPPPSTRLATNLSVFFPSLDVTDSVSFFLFSLLSTNRYGD